MSRESNHLERNRRYWNASAPDWIEPGRKAWAQAEITWGSLEVPESDLQLLGNLKDKDVLELGCGTAYISYWLARRGANVFGLDLSERQLETARSLQREFGRKFPLIQANAEQVPLRDENFDLVVSEYGASIWADPYLWVPEASRLLRHGGELVFLVNGTLLVLTMPDEDEVVPAGDQLLRPYFGLHRLEWKSDESVSFHLGYGDWIRVLRDNGLEVEALVELKPPGTPEASRFNLYAGEWSQRWPAEEIWKARKR